MTVKYKQGTPLPSHEYVKDVFGDRYKVIDARGFLVGCHGDNISTQFNNPFAGDYVSNEVLKNFGLENVEPLQIPFSLGRLVFKKMPYSWKRKLRYLAGEKKWIGRSLFSIIYNFLRS